MQILQIRAETESIQVEEESLQQLGAIGVRTTLRSVCVHWCLNYPHVFVCVCALVSELPSGLCVGALVSELPSGFCVH